MIKSDKKYTQKIYLQEQLATDFFADAVFRPAGILCVFQGAESG